MDFFWTIVLLAVVVWALRRGQKPGNFGDQIDDGLTETQRRWRASQQSQNPDSIVDQHWAEVEQAVGPKEAKKRRLFIEAMAYIQNNKRPFRLDEWFRYIVDGRLFWRYILGVGNIFLFTVIVPMMLFGSPMTFICACLSIMYDLLMYHVQRVSEVTEWNSEYQEKFGPKNW